MASELAHRGRASGARWPGLALLFVVALLQLGVRVYHTESEALAIAFPEADEVRVISRQLDQAARRRAARLARRPIRDRAVVFYEALRGDEKLGYAVVLAEIGKTLPFRFLVAIRPDGKVDQVLLLDYREPRGYEIERPSFRRQFAGKSLRDPIRRGRDLRNVSGATLSVDALARGVRRALALYEVLLAPRAGRVPRSGGDGSEP